MFNTLTLKIDSIAIAQNQIAGVINISRRENESSIMSVTLITAQGVQNIDSYAGKPITLDIDSTRVFTGVIDRPEIDLVYKRITMICTDKRRETLNLSLAATIGTIGFYSPAIFSDTDNVIDELDQRLTTVPEHAEVDQNGVTQLTSLLPKAVADITLLNADILRRKPEVIINNRAKITNKVNLTFKYRYNRLRHRERNFKIENDSFCYVVQNDPQLKFWLKDTFYQNAKQMTWAINESSITYTDLPPSGNTLLLCGINKWVITNVMFATEMFYKAATRFSQTITEQFDITVQAPQSITQYGTVEWNQNNGYRFDYNSTEWEKTEEYRSPVGGIQDSNDYYIDQKGLSVDFDNSILTAINIAKTKILKSHRNTIVKFETSFRSDFNLTKTVSLNTSTVSCFGKISSINHNIDITNKNAETTTEISLSTSQGSAIETPIIVPTRPLVPVIADAYNDPEIFLVSNSTIDTPPIDDTSRLEQIVSIASSYDVEIDNNNLVVTF